MAGRCSGIAIGIGVIALLALTWLLRGSGAPFWLAGAAAVLLVTSPGWFFLRVYPMNVVTQNWTVVPDNWEAVRAQWESGHAVNAALTFLSFLALRWWFAPDQPGAASRVGSNSPARSSTG